uniref:Transcription initiation factor TFIID subunit 9 n=1 Tax=Chloropicon laureae TaxID=464258 RepID=A0A7S2YXA8_9CHLO|mmetsp:Transcript_31703/g.68609  ORF Transcript_31703/g.68609 Transcript_31703/m.68609 type:complete len:145 (-) Transcript_31703:132-566(-)
MSLPSTALAVEELLKEMGVEEYEPKVVYQILEFANLYVKGVVEAAEEYALHAGRGPGDITQADISLATGKSGLGSGFAAAGQADPLGVFEPVVPNGFPSKPNVQLLKKMAARINARPLPPVNKKVGLSLPPDESCLTAQNFEIP